MIKSILRAALMFAAITSSQAQLISPSFSSPDTICLNQALTFTNTTTGPASSYYWNICSGPSSPLTQTSTIASSSYSFNLPVYLDVVKDGANYHMFVTNNNDGTVSRLDFGTSLNNPPTAANLGYVLNNIEDIHVEKEGSNWYGIAVGGLGPGSVVRLNFGTSIVNTPTVVNMGNIGTLGYPHTLIMFRSGGNCYGLTINQSASTITRFDFGNSIANVPTGVNFGNIGGLNGPSQMALISHNGNWHAFICNDGSVKSITRLDFGNSLTNLPTATNIGNVGGMIGQPRGLSLWTECGNIKGLLADNATGNLLDLNFPSGATGAIAVNSASFQTNSNYPQTIYRMRHGSDILYYIVDVMNNSLARINVPTCSSVPASTLHTPSPITFSSTGKYVIYMNAEDAGYNNGQACRNLVVVNAPNVNASSNQTICTGKTIVLSASGAASFSWSTGASTPSINVTPLATTIYTVEGRNTTACAAKKTITVTVSDCVILKEFESQLSFQVYPNPSASEITLISNEKIQVEMYDVAGRLIGECIVEANNKHTLFLKEVPPGIYTLRAVGQGGTCYVKLVRE